MELKFSYYKSFPLQSQKTQQTLWEPRIPLISIVQWWFWNGLLGSVFYAFTGMLDRNACFLRFRRSFVNHSTLLDGDIGQRASDTTQFYLRVSQEPDTAFDVICIMCRITSRRESSAAMPVWPQWARYRMIPIPIHRFATEMSDSLIQSMFMNNPFVYLGHPLDEYSFF